jgi:two-component system alkaline phosphatase synthesis response regulator PhoP
MSTPGLVERYEGSERACVAAVVSADLELLAWLGAAVPSVSFRRVDPADDGYALDGAGGAPVTLLDESCLERRGADDGRASLTRWMAGAALLMLVRDRDPRRVASLLDAGADDAICEPFLPDEVRARIASLYRRAARREPLDSGSVWYDRRLREVIRSAGPRQRLTRSESIIVESLLDARGRTVSREWLLRRLAPHPLDVKSNIVDRHVATLRAKLGDDPRQPRCVATVAGFGYRLMQAAVWQRGSTPETASGITRA